MTENTVKRRRGRPRKDPVGHSETKAMLIRAGLEVLTEKGYSSAGLDEILRRVRVPKGSFYHYFASKDAYGEELIRQYASFFRHRLNTFFLDASKLPLDRLRAFTDDAVVAMASFDFKRGCLVGNLGQEMGALPESFRALLTEVFEEWQEKLAVVLLLAKQQGHIAADVDTEQAAYVFWVGWEGAVLRAKLERSPNAMKAFATFFLSSLK